MASKEKIIEMIGLITTMYPHYADKLGNVSLVVDTWDALLKEYDDDAVTYGFTQALKTSKYPPAPAEVIEHIKSARKTLEPTNEELWTVFEDALRKTWDMMGRFNFTFRESNGLTQGQNARNKVDKIFDELPPKVKAYVASKGELMNLAKQWAYEEDFLRWEKKRFIDYMPMAEKRAEFSGMLTGEEKWLLGG